MSNKNDPKFHSLEMKKSVKTKNGLKKQELRIAFGDWEDEDFAELLIDLILSEFGDKYYVTHKSSRFIEELLEFAETGTFDIFILYKGCIKSLKDILDWDTLAKLRLEMISQIKSSSPSSMIIIVSASGDKKEKGLFIESGTDFYLRSPVKLDEFKEAFEKCLNIRSYS